MENSNRVIKFRAWDNEKKRMLLPAKDILLISSNGVNVDSEQYAIMQYTGLHDKNGKEIYEGDIVRFGERNNYDSEIKIGQFEWNEYGFEDEEDASDIYTMVHRVLVQEKYRKLPFSTRDAKYSEVIGNVWENPELKS